ncbi:hypothetical protein [Methanothrix harundinacea]|uniref:hypothetical protein n=1 Tax=Methanothrix harundinacea TaxID=301375 RepID=UPI00064FCD04|nr:hypothetical protein [Methanothrix harundinacea]
MPLELPDPYRSTPTDLLPSPGPSLALPVPLTAGGSALYSPAILATSLELISRAMGSSGMSRSCC